MISRIALAMKIRRFVMSGDFNPMTAAPLMEDDAALRRKRLLMLMRGRYHWAILLAAVFGVTGMVAGYLKTIPEYRAVAVVHIEPVGPKIIYEVDNTLNRRYDQFVNAQVATIQSSVVLDRAVADPRWDRAIGFLPESESMARLENGLQVYPPGRRQETITLYFNDPNPEVARAGVQAVLDAYLEQRRVNSERDESFVLRKVEERLQALTIESQRLHDRRSILTRDYGNRDAINDRYTSLSQELSRAEMGLVDLQRQVADLESPDSAGSGSGMSGLELQRRAANDPNLAGLLAQRSQAQSQLDILTNMGRGEHHYSVKQVRAQLDNIQSQIDSYMTNGVGMMSPGPGGGGDEIAFLKDQEQSLIEQVAQLKSQTQELSGKLNELDNIEYSLASTRDKLAQAEKRMDQLTTEDQIAGNAVVLSPGDQLPSEPYNVGKRYQMAALGGIAGVALGFGIVLLVGIMDRKLRHADDATTGLHNARMLGILPSLPNDLSDPEQAALAAHAVHHIRTLLQIGVPPREEGGCVYAVTGAAAGSGKTSLSTALGLSFAASGSRTLMIDADIIAAGLTRRFANKSAIGLLDACAGTDLRQCVTETGIDNLDILSVGAAQPHQAGVMSPEALRHLIERTREVYDVVLVDTGPVLGSLEASSAAVVADSTVLVCSRGDQKTLTHKSLEHLQSLDARIAGVVFNHALDEDLAKSSYATMSEAQSRRTEPPAPIDRLDPETSNLFGPLASAVAAYGNNANGNHHRRIAALKGVAKDAAARPDKESADWLLMVEDDDKSIESVKGKAG